MMIDFACKEFHLDEIVKCGLGITKADFVVLDSLVRSRAKWCTTEELAKKLKLDLTTVQRAVKKLHEKNVLNRKQQNRNTGGYVFVYQAKDGNTIRKIIMDLVTSWKSQVEKELGKW